MANALNIEGRDSGLTEVVDQREETGAKEHGEQHGEQDIAVLKQARRQCAPVFLPELDADEDDDHGAETTEQANDLGVVPRVLGTTPLQSEEEADDGGDEDGRAIEIELTDSLNKSLVDRICRVTVDLDEEEDDNHGKTTDGQVDVEAPAPSDVLGEDTTQKRAGDGCDTPHTTDEAKSHRSSLQRHCGHVSQIGLQHRYSSSTY